MAEMSSTGSPTSSASAAGSEARSSGSRSTPSTRMARSQVRWLSPTCSSSTRDGSTPKRAAKWRWKPIATLHRPMARWPASLSAWVTIPTGFVKSTIHASRAARRSAASARSRMTGIVRSAFMKPPGPVVSWPTQPKRAGDRLVAEPGRLAADAELDHDEIGAVEAASRSRSSRPAGRPSPGGRGCVATGRRRWRDARRRCPAGPVRPPGGGPRVSRSLRSVRACTCCRHRRQRSSRPSATSSHACSSIDLVRPPQRRNGKVAYNYSSNRKRPVDRFVRRPTWADRPSDVPSSSRR